MAFWHRGWRAVLGCVVACVSATAPVAAQAVPFVGGVAGVATLSADARTVIDADAIATSAYVPENGPAVNLFAGVHLSDYISLQGNYLGNANAVTLTASTASDRHVAFYEQQRTTRQHAIVGDLLVYFRDRDQRVRPYLSVGFGLVHFTSRATQLNAIRGELSAPPDLFTSTAAVLRVAVGIDVAVRHGWAIRYTFSESLRANPISAQLAPPGPRALANFQNLFGVVKTLG
jgi:hypothetical protein